MKTCRYAVIALILLALPAPPPAHADDPLDLYTGDIVSINADQIILDDSYKKKTFVITPETRICIDGFVGESWQELTTAKTATVSTQPGSNTAIRIDNIPVVIDMGGIQFQPVLPECMARATTVQVTGWTIQVREVQELLVRAGIQTGPLDGRLGPLTAAAIRAFQKDQGLEETGQITKDLVERLRAAKPQPLTATPSAPQIRPAAP
ncbi:MAG: peptidoglycan-binding protein [Deltaproteobacteria bacterium]|nr:peptidoglycan-binding protein [Deltaproteobacteria bacterium]